ncbi:MAG: adenylate/guanylate cyclase domain-containing protein [Leptospirales bacterium]
MKRSNEIENLSFAVTTLLMVLYYIFASIMYNSKSVEDAIFWMHLSYVIIPLFASGLTFFIYHLSERKVGIAVYIITSLNIIFGLALWFGSPQYTLSVEGAVPFHVDWLGIIYYDPKMGFIMDMYFGFLFVSICYLAYILISAFKEGKKYLLPAVFSILIYFVTAVSDMLVSQKVYELMYLMEFGFMAIILNMAYTLLNKFVALYAKVEQQTKHQVELNTAFRRFVPHEFISFLNKESIIDLELGDQVEKKMTVMFSDIRNFTTLSESMSAEENFNFLNSYLQRVGPVIRKNSGFIDKYIGDAIMALFPESVDNAVSAAVEMRKALFEYNIHRTKGGYEPIDVGIGIHTGTLMLGTIGESQRMEGTVISDAVNLAARLEKATKAMRAPVIISKECAEALQNKDAFDLRFLGKIKVKGKKSLISLVEVMNGDSDELLNEKMKNKDSFEEAIALLSGSKMEEAGKLLNSIYNPKIPDPVVKMHLDKIATL